ncbi:substrate-binding domain-containing protein [Candidatus Methylacidiphilum infernorum]|uniref:Xre family transcriptional regulator fused to periplasmic substrate-binding domain n=1 Tax=Methylacidiphilum infernorum (isolate V4) TaxID=481448 RepID=B3DVV5_METI4|nr:substrate-binding domain-containing protein [Candidatus Methylacidiphilum infernorum]ACD83458.1 Xre family transcriptional regulator fused to periplasmic substrate-binding domain [Methylacidiphilum infernorum V4]
MPKKLFLNNTLSSPLRLARIGKGLSQKELAAKIGVSRQTIHAMENGLYVPNTAVALRLARVLEKTVEFLFPYSPDFIEADVLVDENQKISTRYVVGEVRGRKIAWPSTSLETSLGFFEANALRLPSLVNNNRQLRLLFPYSEMEKQVFLLGCDPALGLLSSRLSRYSDFKLWWVRQSSLKALEFMKSGFAHIGGFHFPKEYPKNNVESGTEALMGTGGFILSFSQWEEGFAVQPANPLKIYKIEDLLRKEVRFVNRDHGSGSRILFDHLLSEADISPHQLNGYTVELPSSFEVARAVSYGFADVALTSRACAEFLGLDFIPLYLMEFCLVVPKDLTLYPPVEKFLDFLQSGDFKEELTMLPGYNFDSLGKIIKEIHGKEKPSSSSQ